MSACLTDFHIFGCSLFGYFTLLYVFSRIVGLGFEIPSLFGWGGTVFDDKSHHCAWKTQDNFKYFTFLAVGPIFTPSILTVSALEKRIPKDISRSRMISHRLTRVKMHIACIARELH